MYIGDERVTICFKIKPKSAFLKITALTSDFRSIALERINLDIFFKMIWKRFLQTLISQQIEPKHADEKFTFSAVSENHFQIVKITDQDCFVYINVGDRHQW